MCDNTRGLFIYEIHKFKELYEEVGVGGERRSEGEREGVGGERRSWGDFTHL